MRRGEAPEMSSNVKFVKLCECALIATPKKKKIITKISMEKSLLSTVLLLNFFFSIKIAIV